MTAARRRGVPSGRSTRSGADKTRWLLVAAAVLGVVVVAGFLILRPGGQGTGSPVAWTRFRTADVHSLAFLGGDTQHVLFGHHGGLFESTDGGREWRPMSLDADAMSLGGGDPDLLFAAGHLVFYRSTDGGGSWQALTPALPSLDIHGFAQDPADPAHVWVYLAEGIVYESRESGDTFELVFPGHRPLITAIRDGGTTSLVALDPQTGLVRSRDGGRSWESLSEPPAAPVLSLAATRDGAAMVLGAGNGLYRSDDGGRSWQPTGLRSAPFAIAVSADGETIAAVTRDTSFYRSDDGGRTWPGP